jgi:hypothetical protein
MAADIHFAPLDDRGIEILDELERKTGHRPYRSIDQTGERHYVLDAEDVGVDGFDAMLDRIDGFDALRRKSTRR